MSFWENKEEKEFEEDRKERDLLVFNPSGPIKVLQKQRANLRTGYEQIPQHSMCAQKGQDLHPPLVMTNKGECKLERPREEISSEREMENPMGWIW